MILKYSLVQNLKISSWHLAKNIVDYFKIMPGSRIKVFILTLESIVYFFMLGIGIYFIYDGGLVQQYQLGRTSFALYEEPISVLPTMVTFIKPWNESFTFEKDFNISIYFKKSQYETNQSTPWSRLTYGQNMIDTNVTLHMHHFYDGLSAQEYRPNFFKIRAIQFPAGKSPNFVLKYTFGNSTNQTGLQIALSLRSENSSGTCNAIFHDGKVDKIYLNPGTYTDMVIRAEKHIHLSDISNCRRQPYMAILDETLMANIQNKCTTPCKPEGHLNFCAALRLSKRIDQLPVCSNNDETQCFNDSFTRAREYVDTFNGPCTKVEYSATSKKYAISGHSNDTKFRVTFNPLSVKVSEEYSQRLE